MAPSRSPQASSPRKTTVQPSRPPSTTQTKDNPIARRRSWGLISRVLDVLVSCHRRSMGALRLVRAYDAAFFGHLKQSICGTYCKVSHRWLQGYLNEFVWRRNAGSRRKRCLSRYSVESRGGNTRETPAEKGQGRTEPGLRLARGRLFK
jgi:hypothetical protein